MKNNKPRKIKNLAEFRRDPVSGDWVLISISATKKPVFFKKPDEKPLPKSACPFEGKGLLGREKSVLWLPKPCKHELRDWWVQVFPNKYPVVESSKICPDLEGGGLYQNKIGVGFQDVIVTRDHYRHISLMKKDEIRLLLEAYIERYQALRSEPCVEYILIIHNHGPRAGATVPHPHSQVFAIPIIPPDVTRSMNGSGRYFAKHKRCVHCDIIKSELKEKKRIIYQNKLFVVIAPYASKVSYEIRIFPRVHESRFEMIDGEQREWLAETMRVVFSRMYKNLKNPDYNFFIHTSPPKELNSKHYHWHMEILPRVSTWGGLELGAGIEVIKVSPEDAAKILRK